MAVGKTDCGFVLACEMREPDKVKLFIELSATRKINLYGESPINAHCMQLSEEVHPRRRGGGGCEVCVTPLPPPPPLLIFSPRNDDLTQRSVHIRGTPKQS